jgi:histidinol-phosphatase (PHP family)
MIPDTDFHSHVVRSSARQMAQTARMRGLRVLGLSEHVFQMSEGRAPLEHMPLEGPMLTIAQYIEAVQAAAYDASLDVRLGLEVDFVPQKNEQIQAALRGYDWDFLIGSVHEIDGQQFEQDRQRSQSEGEALWLRYYQLLRAAVQSGFFSLISHPVRLYTTNPYLPPTLDAEIEQLAAEATRQNVALEVNGYDVLHYPHMVQRLVRACALHATPISVGSDAHKPKQIAQAHAQTEALLHEVGISRIRIWKQRVPEEYTF